MSSKIQTLDQYLTSQHNLGYRVALVQDGPDGTTTDPLEVGDYTTITQVRSDDALHHAIPLGAYPGWHLIAYSTPDHLLELAGRLNPALEVGCLFDGARGYEANAGYVIALAKHYGFVPEVNPEGEDELSEDEILSEDEQDATKYLEQFAPDGHWVGWHDGDFGVWPSEGEGGELGESRSLRELEGEEYDLIQSEEGQNAYLDYVDWDQALEACGWITDQKDVTGVVVKLSDGEIDEIWGSNEGFPYGLDCTYYRLK